jgi:hypothetical protein
MLAGGEYVDCIYSFIWVIQKNNGIYPL